jgi:hypothetical protein
MTQIMFSVFFSELAPASDGERIQLRLLRIATVAGPAVEMRTLFI